MRGAPGWRWLWLLAALTAAIVTAPTIYLVWRFAEAGPVAPEAPDGTFNLLAVFTP